MNQPLPDAAFGAAPRRAAVPVRVGRGASAVTVGGGAPIVVQSMTNTATADVEATARQAAALTRITVDRDEAAAAVPRSACCCRRGSATRSASR